MTTRYRVGRMLPWSVVLLLASTAWSATFDGSEPLVCGVFQAVSCEKSGECEPGAAAAFNLPQLLRIDFKEKTLKSARPGSGERVSALRHQDQVGESLVLQGGEEGRGWTVVIHQETGGLTGSVVGEGVGFLVFGSCAAF